MATLHIGKRKTIFTVLVVMCGFAVLWPKIFYPLFQASFSVFVPDGVIQAPAEPNYFPTHVREAMGETRPDDSANQKSNARLLSRPSGRWGSTMQTQGSGAFGIVMPFYTVAIAIFFAYTILKLLLKKPCPHTKMPLEKKSFTISNGCESLKVPSPHYGELASAKTPPDCRTKQLIQEYGRERVINALKTLIEEMAEGKPHPLTEKWKPEQASTHCRNRTLRQTTFANTVK